MSWQFWVIVVYAVINLAYSAYLMGRGKSLEITPLGLVMVACWYAFIIWTVGGVA